MDLLSEIRLSYLQLKREVFYDNNNLYLRETIARFEHGNFENSLLDCANQIKDYLTSPKENSKWLERQLSTIDVFLLPKKLYQPKQKDQNNIISNVRESDEYEVEDLLFYFTGNIQLYLLSTLWCRIVGKHLDAELIDDCYGNRLEYISENTSSIERYSKLFKTYFKQYSKWRDNAIDYGLSLLNKKKNVLLIALDMKQCYHRLETDWKKILIFFKKKCLEETFALGSTLTFVLKSIHKRYHSLISSILKDTIFSEEESMPIGLPIGLPSSHILANWALSKLDEMIINKVSPSYYGRYVDDLLIVLDVPKLDKDSQTIESLLNRFFLDTKILEKGVNNQYKVNNYKYLMIQQAKIVAHYYQFDHSWAGLKEFKEEIKNRSSEFRFLPTEDDYKDLADEAYDLHYDGSIYKFRSLIGITENQNKLKQYIYKQQLKAWLCSRQIEVSTVEEFFLFYKGRNILNYLHTWEKIFTLFLVTNKKKHFDRFEKVILNTIKNIAFKRSNHELGEYFETTNNFLSKKLQRDMLHYLTIAKTMAIGHIDQNSIKDFLLDDRVKDLPVWFRKALLLRKQNIIWPLLDYTEFTGSLVNFKLSDYKNLKDVDPGKLKNSTRYIHPDEQLLLWVLINIMKIDDSNNKTAGKFPFYSSSLFFEQHDPELDSNQSLSLKNYNRVINKELEIEVKQPKKELIERSDESQTLFTLGIRFLRDSFNNPDNLCIGIANVKVSKKRVKQCMKSPNPLLDSFEKQNTIFNLLNEANKDKKCDLVVFPEVFIPFGWLPFMVAQSRKLNIGLIFGIEHVNIAPHSFNFVATLLPFKDISGYSKLYVSLRLKNYYAPKEVSELNTLGLRRPELPFLYERFHWHGTYFTVFNCYELTDILHRGSFRSDIDFLAVVEYNKDINYYSNLLEAVARDVHCFAVQANTSEFGDSRVIAPKSTEEQNFIRIKGGENAVLLKTFLPISDLRDFQIRTFNPLDTRYKPTPAGYSHSKAKNRK